MKKILSLIFCSLGVLALVAACDSNKAETPQSQVTANQPQTKTKEQIKEEQRRAMSTEVLDKPNHLNDPLPVRR
jgi:hypothetical protein